MFLFLVSFFLPLYDIINGKTRSDEDVFVWAHLRCIKSVQLGHVQSGHDMGFVRWYVGLFRNYWL